MKQYLGMHLQAMANNKITEMVDPATMERLKGIEPHPEIRAYVIGHEGTAKMQLENGIGDTTFKWAKRAIRWLTDKLNIGTAVFNRHTATNTHAGRVKIGEVVGKKLVEIGEKVSSVAAFYIYPEHRQLPLDVASIEADIEFETDERGQSYPIHVQNVTGIALSNSGTDSPGFPGATILGAVTAFHGIQATGETTMNLSELKEAVKSGGFAPSQVFSEEEILGDAKVESVVKKDKANLYEQNKRLESDVVKLKDDMAKVKTDHDDEMKQLKASTVKASAEANISRIAETRNITGKQLDYIKSDIRHFSTDASDDASLEADINKFIDAEMVDMKTKGELLGVKIESDEPGETTTPHQSEESEELLNQNPPDAENALIPGSAADIELNK